MQKKHIALVSNYSWTIYRFRLNLAKHLIKLGHDVTVIAPKEEHTKYIIEAGCKFVACKVSSKSTNPIEDARLYKRLLKIYQDVKPDLVFHYTIKPIIWGGLAAKKANVKSIAVTTGLGYVFIKNNLISKIAKRLYKKALEGSLQVWFLNEHDRERFVNANIIQHSKSLVIPGEGIDLKGFEKSSQTKNEIFTFLYFGRMLWVKGLKELIDAQNILKKQTNIKFQVHLLGFLDWDNPSSISKEQILKWEAANYAKYLGSTDDIKSEIEKVHCVVLPSYSEGVPMSLMEAAALQIPIIATNIEGCNDIVVDQHNGFLCQTKNAQDLADKMEKMLLLNDQQRAKMGENGRQLLEEKFDQNIVFKFYEKAIATWV